MTDSWVAGAMRRIADYQRQDVCFLTKLEPVVGVLVRHEPCQVLLRRPRVEITCATGTDVDDIRAAMRSQGLESLYDLWWVKNGSDLVRKGHLHE